MVCFAFGSVLLLLSSLDNFSTTFSILLLLHLLFMTISGDSESFHARFSLSLELILSLSLIRGRFRSSFVIHDAKPLQTLLSFCLDLFFRHNSKARCPIFHSLRCHLFRHDAKAFCTLLLDPLLLLDNGESVKSCSSSLRTTCLSRFCTTSKPLHPQLFQLLWRQIFQCLIACSLSFDWFRK